MNRSLPLHPGSPQGQPGPRGVGRASIRVYFRCANRYTRVLRDANKPYYLARCPLCGQTKSFAVGPDGTDQRLFELTC